MASAVAMLIGGAITNALAFSGSNYLFSHMGSNAEEERERHDKAIEKLQKAQAEWAEKRSERLDFINAELKKQNHASQTFDDVEQAMRQYNAVTEKKLDPLPKEPTLSDYYTPSSDQQNREIAFIIGGMAVTGFLVYEYLS